MPNRRSKETFEDLLQTPGAVVEVVYLDAFGVTTTSVVATRSAAVVNFSFIHSSVAAQINVAGRQILAGGGRSLNEDLASADLSDAASVGSVCLDAVDLESIDVLQGFLEEYRYTCVELKHGFTVNGAGVPSAQTLSFVVRNSDGIPIDGIEFLAAGAL